MKDEKWILEGLVVESLRNGVFRVRLDNDDLILGYISRKIRRSYIRILPCDRVKIEVSRYDSTRGHIIFRIALNAATKFQTINWIYQSSFRCDTI